LNRRYTLISLLTTLFLSSHSEIPAHATSQCLADVSMSNPPQINIGDQIDHYLIKEFRGTGTITLVYIAEDVLLNRLVAIKIGSKRYSHGPSPLLYEAQTLVDLNAPHTTRVLAVGSIDGEHYYVYEYMAASLRQEIEQHKRLSWRNCLRSLLRIAEAIDHLHRRGYVHADIRPRNVMYDTRGFCYLSDMATTRHAEGMNWNVAMEFANKNIDLVKYAPPEARLKPDEYMLDPSFDIWSLGLVMYEALTGVSLVVPNKELFSVGFNSDIKLPTSFDATIPAIFDDLCSCCLSLEPQDRFPISQVLTLLRQINESEKPFKPKVFISHTTADREFVEEHIVGFLESNGINTWYSKAEIQSASEWERGILQGLQESAWFLLVMSEASSRSEWVKDEVFWAIDNRQERIIPVLIDQVDMGDFHIRLRRIQAIDMRFQPEVVNEKILKALWN
ncbi:MAG: serine/threonine protein kinase, partial [Dinoroseobacter sp.]